MELASICRRAHTELEGTAILSRSRGRDRWFESTFLQRGVCKPPVPLGRGAEPETASPPLRAPPIVVGSGAPSRHVAPLTPEAAEIT